VTETENGFIVGTDVPIGNVEHLLLTTMLDTVESDFGEHPQTVMGDLAYATGQNLAAMEAREQELLSQPACEEVAGNPAHREGLTQPVAEEDLDRLRLNAQTKRFDKQAFIYDEEWDRYYCPAGKPLNRHATEKAQRGGETVELVVYLCDDCTGCQLAARCRKNSDAKCGRRVKHDGFEAVRLRHSEQMRQEESRSRYMRRLHFGEAPFAVLKAALDLRRFLPRGIEGVQQEWLWGCTAFNLRKLISLWGEVRAKLSEMTAVVAS
jgi:hypothetical protein